jgi:hypothetical protein
MPAPRENVDSSSRRPLAAPEEVCPRCGESRQLAKIKGCTVCLTCGFKQDCNGW